MHGRNHPQLYTAGPRTASGGYVWQPSRPSYAAPPVQGYPPQRPAATQGSGRPPRPSGNPTALTALPPMKQEPTSSVNQSDSDSDSDGASRGPGRHTHPTSGQEARRMAKPYSPNALKLRRKQRKNTREKQRRMELNDKFDKLSKMLNLGRKVKTEKFTILTEAITTIAALKKEVDELKHDKYELRGELQKLTSCLQTAFPPRPEISVGSDTASNHSGRSGSASPASGSARMDLKVSHLPPSGGHLSPVLQSDLPPIPRLRSSDVANLPLRGSAGHTPTMQTDETPFKYDRPPPFSTAISPHHLNYSPHGATGMQLASPLQAGPRNGSTHTPGGSARPRSRNPFSSSPAGNQQYTSPNGSGSAFPPPGSFALATPAYNQPRLTEQLASELNRLSPPMRAQSTPHTMLSPVMDDMSISMGPDLLFGDPAAEPPDPFSSLTL